MINFRDSLGRLERGPEAWQKLIHSLNGGYALKLAPPVSNRLRVVLFTTGYSQESVFQHGAFEPSMQLLPKPVTVEELTSKVRRILGSGRE